MKLYSNEENKRLISLLTAKGREPHSVIITGERGSGRRTLAKYLAASLMCESHSGKPCGVCKSCRMLEDGNHPDFITAKANENGNYKLDDIRALVTDSVIKPNEGELKVYLIPDFDRSVNTAAAVQNVLLKFIEEPPPHCVVILTAVTKEIFLPTVISRCIFLGTERCTKQQAEQWLTEKGTFGQDDIIRAVSCCGGNFGRCLEFLEGGELPAAFECAKAVCAGMLRRDEYQILKALFMCDGKKAQLRQALVFLSEILRGACLISLGTVPEDCCFESGASQLSSMLGSERSEELYRLVTEYIGRLDSNCNQALTVNSLTGEIFVRL
ncbi:DNA polymerase-3 subunit delta' [Ruminococcaceae bacterium FB2012]|nr:DNA polymerase-3 subunit delta' [Ruminococcaceae bacterium FB2012]